MRIVSNSDLEDKISSWSVKRLANGDFEVIYYTKLIDRKYYPNKADEELAPYQDSKRVADDYRSDKD